jgi:4-amino-4-deoxy-L-arabinose transferase-like glycosyltransferase
MKTFSTGLCKLFFFCVIAAFGLIAVCNGFGLGILLAALAILIPYRFKIPHFLPVLLVLSTIVHVIAIFAVQTPLEMDFATMYQAAQQAAVGDFSFQNGLYYFYCWAYQTGFVLWEAAILRLTGSMAAIKLIHALMLSGINAFIYLFARRFVEERAAQAAALLYLVTLFPTIMLCSLTNQHVSAFFLLLGIYILTSGGDHAFSVRRALLAGICLAFGNIMRPEGIVIIAGLLGTAVLLLLVRRSLRDNKKMLLGIVITVVVYLICNTAASWAIAASGINQYGLSNNWPEWKLILGFNHDTNGMYSFADMDAFGKYHYAGTPADVLAQARETEKQVIHDRIFCSPSEMLVLMLTKIQNLWCIHGLGASLGFINHTGVTWHGLNGMKVYDYAGKLDRTVFFCALFFAFWGAGSHLRRKDTRVTFDTILPYMTLMAFFCVFLIIEVQPRYAYLPQIFLYIAAAVGIHAVMQNRKETSLHT